MEEAITTSDALLQRLSNRRKQRLRKNVHLLFLGLNPEETDPIISLLRGALLAPRGRQINSEAEFINALTERSWDLIVCSSERQTFTAKQAMHQLKRLDKDIPVIQLVPHADSLSLLQGLKGQMQAVVPLEEKELLLITIRRELEHLENRRRMRQAESLLVEMEKRVQLLMERSTLAIAYFDSKQLLLANTAFANLYGYDNAERIQGRGLEHFFVQEDKEELREQVQTFATENLRDLMFQLTGRRADNSNFTANIEIQESVYQGNPCIQFTVRAESSQASLKGFTEHDPMTGLYNTAFLTRRLDETTQLALSGGNDCNFFLISIDNYDTIRATHGADACDHIARDIADILKAKLNPVHIKGRISDSTFGVIFHDPSPDKAVTFAETLRAAIESAEFADNAIKTTCSIGVASINDATPGSSELIERAQSAAENAGSKQGPGNAVLLFVPENEPNDEDHAKAVEALRLAVESDQLKLLFQPIVPLSYNSKVCHYEALVRMLDDDQKEITPDTFMSTMEIGDLTSTLDRWVIKKSIRNLRNEIKKGAKHRLFLNISSQTWRDESILPWLSDTLREYRIPADHLVFQMSESECSSNMLNAQAFADGLKELHCLVCVKHHGASSNARQVLRQIPTDYVKIDGSYVQDLANHTSDESFIEMVEDLKSQGKITIAPHVESPKVMSSLWKTGVGLIQGYYLQPPAEEMDYDFFDQ